MTNFATRISTVAMLALAALPIAALSVTAAHAETRVHVADLNLASPEGMAAYQQRAEAAVRDFCLPERTVAGRASCYSGVRAELNEKATNLRQAQIARATTNFAAR
jgi:UrcA family protein